MKLQTKKILAREFLIVTIVLAIGVISFLLTYPYNSYQISKEKKAVSDIAVRTKQLDSLNSSDQGINNRITIDERSFMLLHEFDSTKGRHLSYDELKNLIASSKGRKSYFDEFNNEMKFKDFDDFEDVIQTSESKKEFKTNKQQIDSIRTIKVTDTRQDLYKLNANKNVISSSILTKQEQYQLAIWAMVISSVILILLRFAYYGVSWSISTLRRKENGTE